VQGAFQAEVVEAVQAEIPQAEQVAQAEEAK
jgi:hypothetical protein